MCDTEILVTLPLGKLKGIVEKNEHNNETIFKFLGIPYAKPTIGDLRFKAPQPVEAWQGIKDATKNGDICYQQDVIHFSVPKLGGSENCLFLNVFTKQMEPKNLRPVMVYIHGGAFTMGSNRTDFLGPDLLMTEEIVLVTINYRLGCLGFLNSDDPTLDIPGNAGFKDQNMALKWVQNNIKYFGGDPNNVTIFGESAGAASVHFHVLSPASKGLFHKAILQSGEVFQSWAWGSRNNIQYLVEALGKTAKNDKEGLEILKQTPVEELLLAYEIKNPDFLAQASVHRMFCPIIENPNPTAFLTKEPAEIISSGEQNQVPIMLGYMMEEGIFIELAREIFPAFLDFNDVETLKKLIPLQLRIKKGSDDEAQFVKKIQEVYLKDGYTMEHIYALYSDILFVSGLMKTLQLHTQTNKFPIFFYKMKLDTEINYLKTVKKWTHIKGACHADDLGYLFTSSENAKIKPGSIEEQSFKKVVKIWTNFAKTGDPTSPNGLGVTWKPVGYAKKYEFLEIDQELTLKRYSEEERGKFWMELFEKYQFLCNT